LNCRPPSAPSEPEHTEHVIGALAVLVLTRRAEHAFDQLACFGCDFASMQQQSLDEERFVSRMQRGELLGVGLQ
jgi:hypothetical protein